MDGIDIRKLRAGNQKAVQQWFERYADALHTLVYYRVGGDGDMAADIVQETFLKALERIEDFEPGRGSMFAWLSYLSKNCTKKALRDKTRNVSHATDESEMDTRLLDAHSKIATQPLPEDLLERAETTDLVRIALGSIPRHYEKALRRYYFEQKSVEEISESDGMSSGAVRTLLHRARAAFKEAFLSLAESDEERNLK